MQPLVSVIIPSYNHQQWVLESVGSVLNQSYESIEVFVIDDGSTDKSVSLLSSINDSRVQIISLSENRKFHPRNFGINACSGKYIAFQNSDDVWGEDKLFQQVNYMEKFPDVGVCFTGTNIIDNLGSTIKESYMEGVFIKTNRSRLQWLRYFFEHGNCLNLSSSVVRRNALDRVGAYFNPSLSQLSDFELWIRIATNYDIHILNEALSSFRITGNNMSGDSTSSHLNCVKIEHSQVLNLYAEPNLLCQFNKIFSEMYQHKQRSDIELVVELARYAWSLKTPWHSMFASNLLAKHLCLPEERDAIAGALGGSFISEFYKHRGEISIDFFDA